MGGTEAASSTAPPRADGGGVDLFVAVSGTMQLVNATEMVLTTPSVDRPVLVVADRFAAALADVGGVWGEVHVASVHGRRVRYTQPVLRRLERQVRHYRTMRAVRAALGGRAVRAIHGCYDSTTRLLAAQHPAAEVRILDEGSSTGPSSRQRLAALRRAGDRPRARDRVKRALRADGPHVASLTYVSTFAPALGPADRFVPLSFDAIGARLLDARVDDRLGWIVASRSRRPEGLGEATYLSCVEAAVRALRSAGCEEVWYFAFPTEDTESLPRGGEVAVDRVVEGTFGEPVELRALAADRLPGGGLVTMPRTSAAVSMARMLAQVPVPVTILRTDVPDRDGRNSGLEEELYSVAAEANPRVRALWA